MTRLFKLTAQLSYASFFDNIDKNSIALKLLDVDYTYEMLFNRIIAYINVFLSKKLVPGCRIGFLLDNPIDIYAIYFASFRLGLMVFPISNRHASIPAIEIMLENDSLDLFIVSKKNQGFNVPSGIKIQYLEFIQHEYNLTEIPEIYLNRERQAIILLIHTSGSTGMPKLIDYTIEGLEALIENKIRSFHLQEAGTVLSCSPGYHMNGLYMGLGSLLVGSCFVCASGLNKKDLAFILYQTKPNTALLFPSLLSTILPYLESYVLHKPTIGFFLGGENISEALCKKFYDKTNIIPCCVMGMTECPSYMFGTPDLTRINNLGKKPCKGYEIKLEKIKNIGGSEVGNLWVRSKASFYSYYENAELTNSVKNQDGWINTGDLLRKNPEGYYFFFAREKEVVLRNAVVVPLEEIEQTIMCHNAVLEAVVLAIQVEKSDTELLVAFVRSQVDMEGAELCKILKPYCVCSMNDYKVPDIFIPCKEFPRNAIGKIDKKSLKNIAFDKIKNINNEK